MDSDFVEIDRLGRWPQVGRVLEHGDMEGGVGDAEGEMKVAAMSKCHVG